MQFQKTISIIRIVIVIISTMVCSLFTLIAQLLLYILLSKQLNLGTNPYFNHIRVGKVVILTSKLQIDQLKVVSTTFNTPLPSNSQLVCQAALNSFSIPLSKSIKNRVRVVAGNGCTESYINLTILSNNFNHNIVSYFALNEKVIDSSNFVTFQALFFLTDQRTNMPFKIEHPLKKFTTSNQVKAFSFFSGLQLNSSLSEYEALLTSYYGLSIQIFNINSSVLIFTVNQKCKRLYKGHIAIMFIVYNQHYLNPPQTTRVQVNSLRLTNFKNIIINEPELQTQQVVPLFMGISQIYANNHFTLQFDLITHGRISISSSSQENIFRLTYLILLRQTAKMENQHNTILQNLFSDSAVQSSSSTMTLILIVVGAISAVLIIIIILCCFCCKKQSQQVPGQQQQQQSGQKKEQNQPSLIKLKRSQLLIDQLKEQICSICLLKKIHLMTHCQHFYHLQCLKTSLGPGENCPECTKQLFGRKITVFCRNCSVGYVFAFEQSVGLDDKLGVDTLCQKCKNQAIPESQKEIKSEKSEQVWLQYAIQNNQNLFLN